MKKLSIFVSALFAAAAVSAAVDRSARGADGGATVAQGAAAKVSIEQPAKPGNQCCLACPSLQGQSIIGKAYKKPRKWIALELKYATFVRWQDQLTFTWHVLLDSKKATEKDPKDHIAPYSYYNVSVTYQNIPMGSHAAGVCLPPFALERFGEPAAIGVEITNKEGDLLGGQSESTVNGVAGKWWEDDKIMSAVDRSGAPMIERRQGLVDRSRTPFALVNPNDYEAVLMQ